MQPTKTQELMATISLYTQLLKEVSNPIFKTTMETAIIMLVDKLNEEIGLTIPNKGA